MPFYQCWSPPLTKRTFTATPDYSEERRLGQWYPELIHEISVAEAVGLGLLAPLRVWVYEVDEDASTVNVRAGDLEEEQLGTLMSAAPFFAQTKEIRYAPGVAEESALICCASRKQAYELYKYLRDERPVGHPAPELIVSETRRERRNDILEKFEAGKIDTLINVGVLIEGWNAPRCKVLIDLAPSLSHVRAMQKFFRPMTKWEGREARIYLLVPKNLPQIPVLPMDLFGWPTETYEAGALIAASNRGSVPPGTVQPLKRSAPTAIEKVELVSRIRIAARFERPKLDPHSLEQIRSVLESNLEFNPEEGISGIQRFKWLFFNHALFSGRGEQLLRFVGIPLMGPKYLTLMAHLYPEGVGSRLLSGDKLDLEDGSCYADLQYLEQRLKDRDTEMCFSYDGFTQGWEALAGPFAREPEDDPEEAFTRKESVEVVRRVLATLSLREEKVLRLRYGIGEKEQPQKEIAKLFECSGARIGQLEARGLMHMGQGSERRDLLRPFTEGWAFWKPRRQ
ncbi:MAG: sigma factor-like helix-turn-helix DNA-binding protein [bacterium]|nr:sigma factor-like helix-turn-helix DNA-binding protein [bacterium]